ncbi:hypothetical protein BC941DRAFT_421950 [Chlamydoabsidia padenii]|nr:hypothetical protein BC941DRAFT_421950 [Chlamydoabsidia padenii]
MDPYRPNPYGYNPRGGGPRPYRPNFNRPPPPHYPNPSFNGYPPRPHMPLQAAPPPTDRNKLNTLFVGAIPSGVTDEWIEHLLKTCGILLEWKRVKDQAGNPKGFGFATYHGPDSVLRALRVLGGEENYEGVTLKAQDGSGVEKKLIVKADDNVRQYLNGYKGSKEPSQLANEKEQDIKALEAVTSAMQSISSCKDFGSDTNEAPTTTDPTDTLSKDLAFLRERATRTDQQHSRHQPQKASHSDQQHRWNQDRRQEPKRQHHKQEFVRGQLEQLSTDEYDIGMARDDEEAEQRRQEKQQRELEATFRQREKRFEQHESTQLIDHEDELKREHEDKERRAQDKEYWAKRLAEWDDQVEMKNEKNDFYNDRSRWRKQRVATRRREEERDEKDRRLEMERKQAAEQPSYEHTAYRSLPGNNNSPIGQVTATTPQSYDQQQKSAMLLQMKPIAPTKIKSNVGRQLPVKRASGLGGDDDDDEDNERKKRVLIPLDYSGIDISTEDTTMEDATPLSEEERNQKIKSLISSIPSSEDDLWAWPIRWDVMNDGLVTEKLAPFVNKKIIELVGEEEQELESFILESIKKHMAPSDLVKELEMTLDEDALIFVMKLWRTIIFETERVARHL